jgi:hypothetical protein
MASRDIWSRAGSLQVRDLLASLLSARLLAEAASDPLYVCSPYLTDFPVFDNAFGQFQPLFRHRPEFGERAQILFSQALAELASRMPVRLIGVPGEYADAFLRAAVRLDAPNISGRYASDLYHEKGLLCAAFYLEGSMNFTFSGVYHRDEKITAHTPDTAAGQQKIAAATLEFNRLWETRAGSDIART